MLSFSSILTFCSLKMDNGAIFNKSFSRRYQIKQALLNAKSLGYKYHLQVTTPLGHPQSGSNTLSCSSRKTLYSCQIDRLAAPTWCFSHFPVFLVCILPFSSFWPSPILPLSQAGLLCKPCLPLQDKKHHPLRSLTASNGRTGRQSWSHTELHCCHLMGVSVISSYN